MDDKAKTFWLGLFLIGALFVIGWFVLFLRPSYGDGDKHLRVRFTNVDKVTVGTRVAFAGKPVGEVEQIKEIANARESKPDEYGNLYFFELDLEVDSSVQVYNYDQIVFSTSGLLGEKTINIIPKPTPEGSPPAHEITNDVLYAKSVDKVDEVLGQVIKVSKSFDKSLIVIKDFFEGNSEKTSLAIDQMRTTMTKAEAVFDTLSPCVQQIAGGEGTLGRLIYNHDIYLRMHSVLSRFEIFLSDINRFGLLYQFSGKWRRARDCRECMNECSTLDYQQKFSEINNSLNQISELLKKKSAIEPEKCQKLLDQVDHFTQDLNQLNEKLLADYIQIQPK